MTRVPELLLFLAGFAVLALPGVFAVSTLFPRQTVRERWIFGCALGLAAAVYLAVSLAYVRLWLFYPVWVLLGALALVAWLKQRPRAGLWARPSGRDWLVVVVLALVAIPRFAIALRYELPPGWDPSFHMILARKMATVGRMIFDWRPFEDISLNYPLGSHALVVVLSQIGHIQLHAAFRLLIPALGVLTTALVHLFARKVSDDEDVAILTTLAYGLWAVYGSMDYYRWGGLPNQLAMTFVMAALVLLLDRRHGPLETVSFSLLFTAVLLTHHHVMLASGVVFAMLFVFFFAARRREARHRVILLGLFGSFVLGGFYIVPYALKATSVGSTGVLTFREMFYDLRTIAEAVGVAFLAASLAGVLVHRFARRPAAQLGVLYVVSGSLLALFVVFEYGWRAISPRFLGDTFVAFTPSRFLTDLVYFSSVFAGYALYQLHRLLRVPLVVVFAICLPVAATNATAWAKASVPTGPPELLEVYRWIERHTPPDTLVLTNDRWAVYGTWRRCAVTPIPVSEPSTVDTPKARMFNTLRRGAIPPEAAASKVVQVGLPGPALRPGRVLWRAPSGLVVVEVWPGAPSRAPG